MGIKINKEKTKAMMINARNQEKIISNGQYIEDVDVFVYLGAKVCKEGGGMRDLKNRSWKARGTFNKLKIWISNNILRKTKLRLYKTLVVPVLLYGSQTWKMNKGEDKAVNVFHNICAYERSSESDSKTMSAPKSYWKEH